VTLRQFEITAPSNGGRITVSGRYIARACRWAARYLHARNLVVYADGQGLGRYHVDRSGQVRKR
jgi:hypothetical protein